MAKIICPLHGLQDINWEFKTKISCIICRPTKEMWKKNLKNLNEPNR